MMVKIWLLFWHSNFVHKLFSISCERQTPGALYKDQINLFWWEKKPLHLEVLHEAESYFQFVRILYTLLYWIKVFYNFFYTF